MQSLSARWKSVLVASVVGVLLVGPALYLRASGSSADSDLYEYQIDWIAPDKPTEPFVAYVGDNGKEGYVRGQDLDRLAPSEFLGLEAETKTERVEIPVYAAPRDGAPIVDTVTGLVTKKVD